MPDTYLRSRALPDFTTHRPLSPRRQKPDPCAEPCTPRCPACGGLKCLCRPRFFPGQLLTDDDLNRLEQYVIDKNRLHNRYLHGWGVACGLEVICDMCDKDHVVVRSGYALSPCGDDIVVCGDQSVDICALINQCVDREPLCDPPYDRPPRDCTGGVKKWVLAICYDERPVRGVTAQLGAGDTTCGTCSCGGSGSCGCSGGSSSSGGCGCGGASSKKASGGCGCGGSSGTTECSCGGQSKMPPRRKQYKPQCEPTQICEGYRFVAYPAPDLKDIDIPGRLGNKDLLWAWLYANRSRFGPLLERVLCCITKAMDLRQQIREGKLLNRAFALTTYNEYASALYEFASEFGVHNCSFRTRTLQLRDEARAFNWDAARFPDDNARHAELYVKVQALDYAWLDIVAECLCSALLPACPQPADTNCVPLAVVTISDGECRVVDICNWSQRKLLITWPTITYWLSWLPWHRLLKVIADMCCGPDRKGHAMSLMTLMLGVAFSGMKTAAAQPMMLRAGSLPFPGAAGAAPGVAAGAARIDPLTEALDADNLLTHMLDRFTRLRTEGPEAVDEPGWAGLIARVADASALSPRAEDDPKLAAIMRRLDDAEAEITWLKRGQ